MLKTLVAMVYILSDYIVCKLYVNVNDLTDLLQCA